MELDPDEVQALVDAVRARTAAVVAALGALDDAPTVPTRLAGWSAQHVACHLRYGAEATVRMVLAALHDEETSWYPAGRPHQRPATLRPRTDETTAALMSSLATTSSALDHVWRDLRPEDWVRRVRPAKVEDPKELTVHGLLVLRSTEVEVHGTDLDLGLPDWSDTFVRAALPFRLARLDGRWPADEVTGSWLLVARGGPTWIVQARTGAAAARAVDGSEPPVGVRIEGTSRDVLALLLGRPVWDRLVVDGDVGLAHGFEVAFPGP